jgi:hypothetical protein
MAAPQIELDLQITVPDANRDKLLLLFQQAMDDIKEYYELNPDASPDFPLDHTEPGVGRVRMFYHLVSVPEPFRGNMVSFYFQTVDAANQQQSFLFNGAISLIVVVAASNAGNTKGLSAFAIGACTISNNNQVVNPISDFATASVAITFAPNSVTITLTGEMGETINWKGNVYIVSI